MIPRGHTKEVRNGDSFLAPHLCAYCAMSAHSTEESRASCGTVRHASSLKGCLLEMLFSTKLLLECSV